MKCKRCSYVWLPIGVREIPRNGNLYFADMGICRKCDHVISRINCATPGDLVNAELWAKSVGLEGLKIVDEPNTP